MLLDTHFCYPIELKGTYTRIEPLPAMSVLILSRGAKAKKWQKKRHSQ